MDRRRQEQEPGEIPPVPEDPVNTGFVILDGRHVPRPYVVELENETIMVNGRRFNVPQFHPEFERRRHAPVPPMSAEQIQRRVAWTLQNQGLFIGWSDAEFGLVECQRAYNLIANLASERGTSAKLEALQSLEIPWIGLAQWQLVISENVPNDEFLRQLGPRVSAVVTVINNIEAPKRRANSVLWLTSMLVTTLGAFSLGNLVRFRPPMGLRWSHVDNSLETAKLIRYSVAFLVLLCLIDILCTGISNHVVGIWDLNPYATAVGTRAWLRLVVKVSATLLIVTALLLLRRFHGTQVVAWWLVLVCTVLSFRCAAYNSMLLV